ncbi:MAG: LamG-like jellyroll fold domain-containing protein, partial [Gaiellaceae bacterium]
AGDANGYVIWENKSGALSLKRNRKQISSGNGALTSSFKYFVVTYDGSKVRWYVNGALKTTSAISFPASNGSAALQLGKGEAGNYGNNDLDEVALYGTALSAARIAAHYAAR